MALVGVSDYSGGLAGPGLGADEDLLAQWERSQGGPWWEQPARLQQQGSVGSRSGWSGQSIGLPG